MPYVKHILRSLIEVDPKKAKVKIFGAFTKAQCHYGETAKILGCEAHSVSRWAEKLGIREILRKIEARALREGWHHGRKGGGGYHKDPVARMEKARTTRMSKVKEPTPQ